MMYLRQSTANQSVVIGPFVDATDGNTAETGLTIANTDIRLSKNGGNIVGKNSGGGTHDELGYYTITLDATDTNTVGRLQLMVHVSGALPVYHEFQVLEEAVYDAMFASSAPGYVANAPVNVAQISGDGTAADNLEAALDGTGGVTLSADLDGDVSGVVGAVAGNVGGNVAGSVGSIGAGGITATSIASNALTLAKFASDILAALGIVASGTLSGTHTSTTADLGANAPSVDITGQTLFFPGHGLSRVVQSYNTSTGVATWDEAVDVTLANGDTWHLFATAPGSSGGGGSGDAPSASEVATAVWNAETRTLTANPGLDAAGVRTAIGLASANLDTQLGAIASDAGDAATDAAAASVAISALASDIGANGAGLTAIPWNSAWDAEVQSEVADALADYDPPTAAELASAVSPLATASALATVDSNVDAIKAKTDSLTFTNSGVVDANITHVISDPVQAGSSKQTNWGGTEA